MVDSNEAYRSLANNATSSIEGKKPHLTWREQFNKVRKNITVEPILAAYIIPSVLSNLANQNLNLDKACRVNMNYGDEICDALIRRETANYTMEEETSQKLVAHILAWKTVVQSLFPCLLILFWGSWSDRHHRRKPCILIPIVGEFLGSVGLMFCVYFENSPLEIAGLTEAIFSSISGGSLVLLMGAFSYIADVTTEDERTFRIGILNVCFTAGIPIGTALSGVLLKLLGFYCVFSISAGLYLFCIIYGIFFLKESRARCMQPFVNEKPKSLLRDFFDTNHVVETFRFAFKKGEHKRRIRVILLMIVVMLVLGPIYGEMNVTYLFARYRFNWNELDFRVFTSFSVLTGLVGVLFCIGILSHKFKIDDAIIGILSSSSKILSGFVYAFAYVPWHMYVGAVVDIFNGSSFIAMRSMASKLVSKDELGKVNSLFGVAEVMMPLVYSPMYTILYAATINVFPGAFYMLGGGITVLAVIIFIFMYHFQRQQLRKQKQFELESAKGPNSNISATGAIALASEAKGNPNGLVLNVREEHKCGVICQIDTCLQASTSGSENDVYMPDCVDNVDEKSENNKHL